MKLIKKTKNLGFAPHCIPDCFLRFWQQTLIISVNRINWLAFIMERRCFLYEVGWRQETREVAVSNPERNKSNLLTTLLNSVEITVQQPKPGLGRLFVQFLDHTQLHTHTHTNTHTVGLAGTTTQLVGEATTYTP